MIEQAIKPVKGSRRRSLLRGCGLVSLVTLLIAAGVLAWQWRDVRHMANAIGMVFEEPDFASGLDDAPAMLPYFLKHRSQISAIVATVDAEGNLVFDADSIQHNPDVPQPLASTIKIVVLAAYAQAVEEGALNPHEPITLADWERYYIPGTDGRAHQVTLESLNIAMNEDGSAQDSTVAVPLDTLASAMIRFSDNAATDYLIVRLGNERLQRVITQSGMQHQELPTPFSGTVLLWQNHETGATDPAMLGELSAEQRASYLQTAIELGARYADSEWGQVERAWRADGNGLPLVSEQRTLTHNLSPRGSVSDYAMVMGNVARGTFLSPAVSATMQQHLSWPMTVGNNSEEFTTFGAKGGSLPGVLTEAMYLAPKAGDFSGKTRVVVLFLPQMSGSAWIRLMQTFGQQQAEVTAATERAYLQQMRAALEGTWTPSATPTTK